MGAVFILVLSPGSSVRSRLISYSLHSLELSRSRPCLARLRHHSDFRFLSKLCAGTVSVRARTKMAPKRVLILVLVLSPGIELYEFSIPIGYFCSLRSKTISIGLRFLPNSLPDCSVSARTKMAPKRVLILVLVLSPGIEPESPIPQTGILSIKL